MSYQISFAPRLSINGQPITLTELRNQTKSFGYEYTASQGENGISLGKLGTLADDFKKLAKLENADVSVELKKNIPATLGEMVDTIAGKIADAELYLTHLKIDTETKDKEILITGSIRDFSVLGVTANGFSLNISSGPDGNLQSVSEDNHKVTLTLNKRGAALLIDAAKGDKFVLQSYNNSQNKVTILFKEKTPGDNNESQVATFASDSTDIKNFDVSESIELTKGTQ